MIVNAASTGISASGLSGAAVTLTIPAPPAGQNITLLSLEIHAYTTLARTGAATPVLVATTNLGGLQWPISTAAAVGTTERIVENFAAPVTAVAAGAAVTVACPATLSVTWYVNATYMVG